MSHRFGRITSDLDWIKIEPDLTQAHLADSLGLTRETSGQALKSLEKKGIIRTTSRTHYEVNIKKLKPLIK
jgi:CRP-like cAMP-binding protein